jgi:uncharacterized protein (TIGR03435 family)
MRTFVRLGLFALLGGLAFSQSDSGPKFDVADIHPSAHTTNPNTYMTGGILRGGRYDIRRGSMLDMIALAYTVDPATVVGGPAWLEINRYDIAAKAPQSTPQNDTRIMLQNLLADRFQLVIRKEKRPMPGFALIVPKGGKPKLKEADATSGATRCVPLPQKPAEPGTVQPITVQCRNMTMEGFAEILRNFSGDYLTSPVINMTGLEGAWDFEFKWYFRQQIPQAGSDAITIFDAVDKQLGLKLDNQKVPTPVIIVESANDKPTDNAPGAAQAVPPAPPAEFEVADLKPSPDDEPRGGGGFLPGGRVELRAIPLKTLIIIAWNLNNPDEELVGAPKWLQNDSPRFDFVAKTSTATAGPANAPQIDIDDLRIMVRNVLIDRFKIAAHVENRPITTYTLTATAKPKLAKADPENRTSCKEAAVVARDPRDTNPTRSRLVTCQNTTMAYLAERLQAFAPGYIHNEVENATLLDGAYDFTLSFSTMGFLQSNTGAGRGGDGGQTGAASDPNGGLSLFDAVEKQLGLKLEKGKRPMPVLVVDHIEEKLTEN